MTNLKGLVSRSSSDILAGERVLAIESGLGVAQWREVDSSGSDGSGSGESGEGSQEFGCCRIGGGKLE